MRFASLSLPLLAAHSVLGNAFLDRKAEHEELRRNAQMRLVQDPTTHSATNSAKTKPKFLNDKTKKFSVNGTSLPLVQFDLGESYSGLLPVDDTGRELFFWFFPSSTGIGSKEITIWLNGGPGCSSLEGFFEENGPIVWRPGTYGPVPNPYAYNKLSNVVYIEQPVGTGFSRGKPNATNEVEVAQQFNAFWKNFVDLFGLQHHPIYITGESYAGQYVPYIGDGMLKEKDTKYYNLKGILIYDPVIGPFSYAEAAAVPFTEFNAPSFPFEPKVRQDLLKKQDSCGFTKFLNDGLTFPPKGHLPKLEIPKGCNLERQISNYIYAMNPCFNVYHVSEICPTMGDLLGAPNSNNIPSLRQTYFARDDVKALIHAPVDFFWQECAEGVLSKDTSPGSATKNGPVKRIAEATNNVIVGHGLQDFILLSNQTLLILNDLEWNGAQGFEEGPTKPFYVPQTLKKGTDYNYLGQWTRSRGLTYVQVNLSGHMVPQFQPAASFRHLEVLMGRVDNLGQKKPITI